MMDEDYTELNTLHEPVVTTDTEVSSLQTRLLRSAVDDYYNQLGQEPTVGRNYANFEVDRSGVLRLRNNPDFNIMSTRGGNPLALSTLARRSGGREIIRNELGFPDWGHLSQQAVRTLQNTVTQLNEIDSRFESVELQDLNQPAKEATDVVETTLSDNAALFEWFDNLPDYIPRRIGVEQDSQTEGFTLRELEGLDKAMQTQRGNLTNNLSKLSGLDDNISNLKIRIQSAELADRDEREIAPLRSQLEDLNLERAARLEAISANKEALRSQINRIRETIKKILREDTTLVERIRTLFKEQGITIASILTAFGMIISTIVLAVTGGGGGVTPNKKGGGGGWIQKKLNDLGELLKSLGVKAAGALPGIIGSIVSWLLSTVGKAVGWLAHNLWALVVAAIVLLYNYLLYKPKK